MDSSSLWNREILSRASEGSSLVHLLTYGLKCFRDGHHDEGLTFFALARESLTPNQIHLTTILDALTQSYKAYSHAQEALLQASKLFAQTDAEQQMQIAALEHLLPTLEGEADKESHNVDELLKNTSENQSLHALEPSSESCNRLQLSRHLPPLTAEDTRGNQPSSPSPPEGSTGLPALYITCFGRFEVRRWGKPIVLCSSRSGQSILRYLVAQPGHRATSDTLQTLLWPEEQPEASQNKLHLAISALRRSLNHGCTCNPGSGYIECKNQVYHFNSIAVIQTDLDEFLQCYQAGRQTNEERIAFYERACRLYTGPFFPEDRHADWSFLQREQLSRAYLTMCRVLSDHYLKSKQYEDAARWATSILQENHCDEWAYRQLMHIYAAQGCRREVLQQYQRCQFVLHEELGVQPSPETLLVFQSVLANESPSYHNNTAERQQKYREDTAPHDTVVKEGRQSKHR